MTPLSSLSCVLLAYNEEDVIARSIARVKEAARGVAREHEVVVVGYEGARDRTLAIVRELAAADPSIRLVVQPREAKGYGRAMVLGLRASRMDWVFQTDADGQYDFADLAKLVARVDGSDVVLVHGYRSPRRDARERLLFAWLYNQALRAIYRLPIRDADSAFKLMRGDVARSVPLQALTGFAVTELVMRLWATGGRIEEVGVTHLPRQTGEALSDKGIANPLGLELPNVRLVRETLTEMVRMRGQLAAARSAR
jgi:glycosyltransferase involved in cell wall biosynthesis